MASVNHLSRELVFKIVYYGPGLGGKTTTLEYLHATAKPEHRGKLVSLATPVDRTLYFDFLPVRLPPLNKLNIRLQLFTVPGQVYFNATRKLVLTGADGIVFVSDSQSERADANLESLENLRENLADQGREIAQMPLVFQHNKRDLREVLPVEELDGMLNPWGMPTIPSCAKTGMGIYTALEAISERVLKAFESRLPALIGTEMETSFEAIEGGLASALRDASTADGAEVSGRPSAVPSGKLSASPGLWSEVLADPRSVPFANLDAPLPAPPLAPSATSVKPATDGVATSAMPAQPAPTSTGAGISFADLWPDGERATVREVESAILRGGYATAVELCDALVSRVLASAAGLFGSAEAPRDPAVVPMLLGLDGRRYLSFRQAVREARTGALVSRELALAAFAFAIDARIARSSVR